MSWGGDDIRDAFARVSFIVLDSTWPIFSNPLHGRGTVEAIFLNERLDGGKFVALDHFEGGLILDQKFGAGARVFFGGYGVLDVGFFETLYRVDHRVQICHRVVLLALAGRPTEAGPNDNKSSLYTVQESSYQVHGYTHC